MGGEPGFSLTHSEFNEFLFAPVGVQENGMTVSVFSALTRLGFDPWREAKRLSGLSGDLAARALGEMIERWAAGGWKKVDSALVAAGLVRLLPRHGGESPSSSEAAPARTARPSHSSQLDLWRWKLSTVPAVLWLVIFVLVMGVIYAMSANSEKPWAGDPGSDLPRKSAPRD